MRTVDLHLSDKLLYKVKKLAPGSSVTNITLLTRALLTKCSSECGAGNILGCVTLKDYFSATEEDGRVTVRVPEYKEGRRLVALSYHNEIRPLVAKPNSKYLFVKSNGKRITKVAQEIKRFKWSIRKISARNKKKSSMSQEKITDSRDKKTSARYPTRKTRQIPVKNLETLILTQEWPGLTIASAVGKGHGLFTTKPFVKGEIICDYPGENVSVDEGLKRLLALPPNLDSYYIAEFKHDGSHYCVDGTKYSDSFGAKINHSMLNYNAKPFTKSMFGVVKLFAQAHKDLVAGEEILWDYAVRGKKGPEWQKT